MVEGRGFESQLGLLYLRPGRLVSMPAKSGTLVGCAAPGIGIL